MCHVWHIEWDHLHMHMWAQRYTCTTISPCISLTVQMQLPSMLSEHGYDQLTSKCIGASVHVQLLIFATSPCHLCMYSAGLGSCMPTGSLGGCCHRSWVGASKLAVHVGSRAQGGVSGQEAMCQRWGCMCTHCNTHSIFSAMVPLQRESWQA